MLFDDIISAKLNSKFLQVGGWIGFNTDGNDEVRLDRTLYTTMYQLTKFKMISYHVIIWD
ncbi:MAG: hypothetical protein AB8U25_00095 [Rickettsiales endosymbiont of Dermacentor nuttalli]